MSMISKELLSEVLGVYVRDGWYFDCELLIYTHDKILGLDENYHAEINIHELAHKCKEWAWEKHSLMLFQTQYFPKVYYGVKDLKTPMEDFISKVPQCDRFSADTEPEAIFKACEYILKEHK